MSTASTTAATSRRRRAWSTSAKGHSRDHRPDLNQVVLQHITENQAGIPLLMPSSGGNINDQAGFRDLVRRHKEQLQADGLQYLVADSALSAKKTLLELGEMTWVSRVPSNSQFG